MKYSTTTILSTLTLVATSTWGFDVRAQTTTETPAPLTLYVDETAHPVLQADYDAWFYAVPYLILGSNETTDLENPHYCPRYSEPCGLRVRVRDAWHTQKRSASIYSISAITDYLTTFAENTAQEPQNAVLAMQDGTLSVVREHTNGITIDPTKNTHLIKQALAAHQKEIALEADIDYAAVRSNNLSDVGLKDIIGEGRSNFAGSSSKRIHNIKTAASKFDDMLIAPGETFSFVANLGPVNGATGYKKELVIRDNKTIPEYGGGVCQVSTTIFRGAVHTGMKINERRNHSYPVKYYEPMGFDATIYLPAPDMKFTNNTKHYVLLDTWMEGTELVFRYYGTDDGRTTQMHGPVVTERGSDGSAKTYFTQTVKDRNGTIIIDDTFYSNYKSPNAYPKVTDTSIGRAAAQPQIFTSKPKDWSKKQWKAYKAQHGI